MASSLYFLPFPQPCPGQLLLMLNACISAATELLSFPNLQVVYTSGPLPWQRITGGSSRRGASQVHVLLTTLLNGACIPALVVPAR